MSTELCTDCEGIMCGQETDNMRILINSKTGRQEMIYGTIQECERKKMRQIMELELLTNDNETE